MSLYTETGAFAPTGADYCHQCRKPEESCRCEAWGGPADPPQPRIWTVTYFSRGLGRRVWCGAMTRKAAEGWVATLRRGRRPSTGVRIARVLPMVRCETPVAPIYHDGPMRPAKKLLEVK